MTAAQRATLEELDDESATPAEADQANAPLPHDPFGLCKPVRMTDLALDRTDRVRLLGEAAQALLDGRLPEPAARIFLASAISAWLARGGNLERDHLKVVKAKSHHTPAAIWRQIVAHQDERHGAESGAPSEHHQLRGTQK